MLPRTPYSVRLSERYRCGSALSRPVRGECYLLPRQVMAVDVDYYERRDDGTNGEIARFRGD